MSSESPPSNTHRPDRANGPDGDAVKGSPTVAAGNNQTEGSKPVLGSVKDTAAGFDGLFALLGLQPSAQRITVLDTVTLFFQEAGFADGQVWVESFRYNILRLGTTFGQYPYVRAERDRLCEELEAHDFADIQLRISKRRNIPGDVLQRGD